MTPYIDRGARADLETKLRPLCDQIAGSTDGQLNYVLTSLILAWLPEHPRYADYARVVGALECCKLELYRERVAPYEDAPKVQHGPLAR